VFRRVRLLAAVAAPVWVVALTTPARAESVPRTTPVPVVRAEASTLVDVQPGIVEDGSYPDAARILAARGITLVAGNGLITLADCGATGVIELFSAEKGRICFKVRIWRAAEDGTTYPDVTPALNSFVVLNIPDVYLIKGVPDVRQQASMTVDNQTKVYDIRAGEWTPVGEGIQPENPPETLVEVRAGGWWW
jgi:hypothetical protein